jgi:hypothetical protein
MAELDLEGVNERLCDKPFSFSSLEKTVVKKLRRHGSQF